MSAGTGTNPATVNRDLSLLAPRFREAVEAALHECDRRNLDAMLYEGYRSQELQAIYYARGRTVIPPQRTVTNAATNLRSWHGYGLAVDVVHRTQYWEPAGGLTWFRQVADVFKRHGCKWGGDWTSSDPPHMQWGRCRPSPSDEARRLLATEGIDSVWRAVRASDADPIADPVPAPAPVPVVPAPSRLARLGAALLPAARPSVLAWGRHVSSGFRDKLLPLAAELGADPSDLMACIAFETGETFSPRVRNAAGSGAVGLIQFMPATATALGTSVAGLATMTAEQQLDYVARYFRPYRGRLRNLGDIYMAILWPRGVGKPDSHVLFDRRDTAHPRRYTQNAGLDADRNGLVTRQEACAKVQIKLEKGFREEHSWPLAPRGDQSIA